MAQNKGLGRGFDSLIPNDVKAELADDPSGSIRTKKVLIQDIVPNPEQPRRLFKDQALQELAISIKEHGILQPVVVIAQEDKYRLVAGERRWRAAQIAGLEAVPAIIRTLNEQQELEMSLIENLQREDLTPLEAAAAFVKLINEFNLTHSEIGGRVGKAETTINNIVRLLNLPDPAKLALQQGRISEGHARQILALDGNSKKQQELLDLIIRHKWTVRQAENFVLAYKEGAKDQAAAVKRTLNETPETKRLSDFIKAPVRIQNMAKGGRLIIDYKDPKDLDRITKKLTN